MLGFVMQNNITFIAIQAQPFLRGLLVSVSLEKMHAKLD